MSPWVLFSGLFGLDFIMIEAVLAKVEVLLVSSLVSVALFGHG